MNLAVLVVAAGRCTGGLEGRGGQVHGWIGGPRGGKDGLALECHHQERPRSVGQKGGAPGAPEPPTVAPATTPSGAVAGVGGVRAPSGLHAAAVYLSSPPPPLPCAAGISEYWPEGVRKQPTHAPDRPAPPPPTPPCPAPLPIHLAGWPPTPPTAALLPGWGAGSQAHPPVSWSPATATARPPPPPLP